MIAGILALAKSRKTNPDQSSKLDRSLGKKKSRTEESGLALLSEPMFRKVLSLERRRSERSGQRFVLMLVHAGEFLQSGSNEETLDAIVAALSVSTRETDLRGWYEKDAVVGVICTEIGAGDMTSAISALHSRVSGALRNGLCLEHVNMIHMSFHVFPDDLDSENGGRPADVKLYPDLQPQDTPAKVSRVIKRCIDIIGSLFALLILSPLLILIAIMIKLTSKGPILFSQQRMGQYGARFTFLKFRSMYFKSDAKIHQEYVQRFISGMHDKAQPSSQESVYKITDDPRVTPVGRLIRRTSLDELPQFFNVLCGEMSLVGPRPPIPYEVERYEIWHRRRFLEVKPGITGLWQVEGRSRTRFDEMVRLDLKYARTWSPWLDIKILLRTPKAVLRGTGAY